MNKAQLKQIAEARAQRVPVLVLSPVDGAPTQVWTPGEPSIVPSEVEAEALRTGKPRLIEYGEGEAFLQVYLPPTRLFVIGGVHIAQALIPLAQSMGYDVTLIDPRGAFATPARFPNTRIDSRWADDAMADLGLDSQTAIVALSHDPKVDDPALTTALSAEQAPGYIGALGSRKTHAGRVARLTEAGFSEEQIGRIHSPVGLNIGAVSPAEIAVSIMAQITAVFRQVAT